MNHYLTKVLTAGALCAFCLGAQANNILDFEGFSKGQIIDNEYASQGVNINAFNVDRNANNIGVIFDTTANNTADPDLEAPFYNVDGSNLGVANPGNVLIIHEHPWECNGTTCGDDPDDEGSRPAGYFDILFDNAVTLNTIDFFDIESGENGNSDNNKITVMSGQTETIFHTPNTGGNNTWSRLNFNVVGVTSIRIKLHGSGAIDNINYSNISVPTPASILVLLLGVGLLHSRRQQTAGPLA